MIWIAIISIHHLQQILYNLRYNSQGKYMYKLVLYAIILSIILIKSSKAQNVL